ncbi:snaclec agglucetin subunit beta-1-like [Dendropsophus ebraccatus]|uniref:snaclec agglucetin subunit beta-1-like n=1 Tax=Dendropsophus ebraccatus TaxID=150705 RepID=UPI0038322A94
MLHLLLLLLVGTISARESGMCPQDAQDKRIVPNVELNKCDMPGTLENTHKNDCQMDTCHNVSLNLKCGSRHGNMFPGKATCNIRLFTSARTFADAQKFCRCHRGHLSSIHNYQTDNSVRTLAQRGCGNSYSWLWIGVYKPYAGHQYINEDGTKLDYTHWAWLNPHMCGSWCTAIYLPTGQWFSIHCCYVLPFVCTF